MINEQKVAFCLMDMSDLICHLDSEGILSEADYQLLKKAENRISELTGFKSE